MNEGHSRTANRHALPEVSSTCAGIAGRRQPLLSERTDVNRRSKFYYSMSDLLYLSYLRQVDL